MLLNDFFRIIELDASADTLVSTIRLNPEHSIFSGHFPNNPVTPGVVQLQIVKEILEDIHKKELHLETIAQCRFLKILNPETTPVIIVKINSSITDNLITVKASGAENENVFFKFNAVYSI